MSNPNLHPPNPFQEHLAPVSESRGAEGVDFVASASPKPPSAVSGGRRIGLLTRPSTLQALSLRTATLWSLGLHVATPVLLGLVFLGVLWILGFFWPVWDWLFPKAQRIPDIEFTLVQDTQAPRPETARFRGEFNQQAGGQPVAKKPPQPLEKPPAASAKPVAETQQPPAPPKSSPTASQAPVTKPVAPLATVPEKTPPQAPLSASTSSPTSSATSGAENSSATGATPAPSSGASSATASAGNPEAGPGENPGVAVQQADFAPYMAELKRRLTRNWHPPRGEENVKVVLQFEIARNGQLINLSVHTPSGLPLADEAALSAVKLSAPFRGLPPEFDGESVPILFTFDYTIYGSKRMTR